MSSFQFGSNWDYQTGSNAFVTTPEDEVPPSSGYTIGGLAPYGTLDGLAYDRPVVTPWAINAGLWLRKTISSLGSEDLMITAVVSNAAHFYINGTYIGSYNRGNLSTSDSAVEFRIVVPKDLVPSGNHTLSIFCQDETASNVGDSTYFDAKMSTLPQVIAYVPEKPYIETLEWKTDVFESYSGIEDRVKLRTYPRVSYEYNYPIGARDHQRTYSSIYKHTGSNWLVPHWADAQPIGAVSSGDISITVDETDYTIRDYSMAMLWESPDNYQIIGVNNTTLGTLTFIGVAQQFTSAYFIPASLGRLVDGVPITTNAYKRDFKVKYEVTDVLDFEEESSDTQLESDDLYTDELYLPGSTTTERITSKVEVVDGEVGVVNFSERWLNSRNARQVKHVMDTREDLLTFKKYLARRSGRYRQYWAPSFLMDLIPVQVGTVTTVLTIKDNGQISNLLHERIAIEHSGGWTFAVIDSISDLGGGEVQLTFASSVGGIETSSIRRVCLLGIRRLLEDSATIKYIGFNAAECNLTELEIKPQ